MRLRLTVVAPGAAPGPAEGVDVVVRCPRGTTFGETRSAVLGAAGHDPRERVFVDGAPLADSVVVGRPPLLDGAVLTAGSPGGSTGRQRGVVGGLLELHVVAGPDAGRVHRLGPGRHRVGRAPTADVRLDDVDVSRSHAVLEVSASGVSVEDAGSTNGCRVDGEPVGTAPATLAVGGRLEIGASVLVVRSAAPATATATATGDGVLHVHRAPRLLPPSTGARIRLPRPPRAPEPAPFPLVAMVLPAVVSVPMAVLWSPFALLLGLTTPVMMLGNLLSDRRSGRRRFRQQLERHQAEDDEARAGVAAACAAEAAARRALAPDAAQVLTAAISPTSLLWQRAPQDPDDLALRVGTGTVPSTVVVVESVDDGEERQRCPDLEGVPVTLPLKELGVIGLCGVRSAGLLRFVVAQVAVLHSHQSTRIVALTLDDGPEARAWSWVRWLPHVREDADTAATVGIGPVQVARRLGELSAALEQRRAAVREGVTASPWPRLVVVLDGTHALRRLPGVPELLADGPAHGIYLVCRDDTQARLPAECRAVAEVTGEVGVHLEVQSVLPLVTAPQAGAAVVVDAVGHVWAERVGRALAGLRDATPRQEAGGLPDQVRLVDLWRSHHGLDPLTPDDVTRLWSSRPRSTGALLGVTADGVFAPDLTLDGPHVLVGGTTGAGKSELLQTLIASLAIGNRPDELAFVLVDYKGGSAFAECAALPHTVGLVTDLDEHLTERALTSLTAEVRRRERLLRDAGAKDIGDYGRRLAEGAPGPALPRLVLVVDEFRVLADELPDFVDGLVRLAAVGRSLGLHLVLATQRPGGAIGPDIRANVNLRIALRVRDRVDSVDVVDAPDAALVDQALPGRGVARSGSGSLVSLQTARVGGRPTATPAAGRSRRTASTGATPGTNHRAGRDPRSRTARATSHVSSSRCGRRRSPVDLGHPPARGCRRCRTCCRPRPSDTSCRPTTVLSAWPWDSSTSRRGCAGVRGCWTSARARA